MFASTPYSPNLRVAIKPFEGETGYLTESDSTFIIAAYSSAETTRHSVSFWLEVNSINREISL